jgi:hypothetical protein
MRVHYNFKKRNESKVFMGDKIWLVLNPQNKIKKKYEHFEFR